MADHSHHNDHAHGDHGHDSGFHASMKDYVIGFVLSVILTAIPFWLVMTGALHSPAATGLVIMGFAAVQIVVHMVYFLHMSPKVEGGQNLLALIFTLIIVMIVLSGSMWVMFHLNQNMMPMPATMDGMG
jgi:cytochrome o ubiquinol oxidase subunit IV